MNNYAIRVFKKLINVKASRTLGLTHPKAEYLDLVDENNNLTGKRELRSRVHSSGLRHRVVHIYYFRKKNNEYYFLVHLRSKTKDLCPNMWDTRFGGHLQAGETVEKALIAELTEELGIKTNPADFIKGLIEKRDNYPNNEFAYVFYYPGQEDISDLNFSDNEFQKVKWLSAAAIMAEVKNNPQNWTGLKSFSQVYNFLKTLY